MSWDTELVERLRYVINDIDAADYTYTATQLQKFLAVAAGQVLNDTTQYSSVIGSGYVINVSATGSAMIQPDPLDAGSIGFENLIVFKAACIIARSELKTAGVLGGWKITDDRSTIDGTQSVAAAKDAAASYCSAYTDTLIEFKEGNRYAGHAILSPFSTPEGVPAGYRYSYRCGNC